MGDVLIGDELGGFYRRRPVALELGFFRFSMLTMEEVLALW